MGIGDGNSPACRMTSHPRGTEKRTAWSSQRSYECGSAKLARGPTTASESEYTYVRVATAGRAQPDRVHPRICLTGATIVANRPPGW